MRKFENISYEIFGVEPVTLWFMGYSGSGKSTLGNGLCKELLLEGATNICRYDGDVVRREGGLCSNLGFSKEERYENLRRVSANARDLNEQGKFVIASFITPRKEYQEMIKKNLGKYGRFIFVDASLETCKERDPNKLYKKALEGKIKNFTGISAPFEVPNGNFFKVNTENFSLEKNLEQIRKEFNLYPKKFKTIMKLLVTA